MSIEAINTLDALKLALTALEYHQKQTRPIEMTQDAIEILKDVIREAALDAMHENEKELGLGFYEQAITTEESSAVQEPVRHADWCASVTQLLLSMPPRKAPCNCQPQPKREWFTLEPQDMPDGEDSMYDHPFFIAGMVWAANKLKEKNT